MIGEEPGQVQHAFGLVKAKVGYIAYEDDDFMKPSLHYETLISCSLTSSHYACIVLGLIRFGGRYETREKGRRTGIKLLNYYRSCIFISGFFLKDDVKLRIH
uniref:Uncharacterized protein n=1 Tax=Parascaris equorum TaxID=6256 RepID=A0A914RLA1_PAREQ